MPVSLTLRSWELASVVSFAYMAIVAALRPGLAPSTRLRIAGGCAAGLAVTGVSVVAPPNLLLHGLLLPPVLLLLAYWISGLFFVAPMAAVERALERMDVSLRVDALSRQLPRPLAEFLECSYAGVYVLIPLALGLHARLARTPDLDRFWLIILTTDYICFGVLPWVQTRPPRAIESAAPWRSSVRKLNLSLLGAASIRVNTFPSGHAAEALAAALLVSGVSPSVFAWMLFLALSVSAGAVLGRYHYAIDALSGWLVAAVVWFALR
jgi:membrane-associated phospholipid phosphatase